MLTLLISIFSLLVVTTTAFILYYKNEELKNDAFAKIQNVINQVNDSQYYEYSFDKKQEQNIKNLDANIELVNDSLVNLQNNVKFLQNNSVDKSDLADKVQTNLVDTRYLKAKSTIIGNGTLQNNLVIEGGRTSDGLNEGYSAINFNGYTENKDKLINEKKSRWRVATDQRTDSDKFGIDQYKPDKTLWNYMWMSDGTVSLNNDKLLFSNKFSDWSNKATDQAEISNDPSAGQLMIVGNKSSGEGVRKVGIWDNLDVHGNQNTTGTQRAANLIALNQICIGNVCLTKNDLLKLKAL